MEKLGKYHIDSIIGRGAMGVVYKAKDPDIDRLVAIKVLNVNTRSIKFSSEAALESFKREAKAIGSLVHPNIVSIFEVNFDHSPPYIVMQYVEGPTFSKLLVKLKKFSFPDVVRYVSQVADALDFAHSKKVVHRDIKPGNLLLNPEGRVFVLDFGVAGFGDFLTQKYVVGTVGYIAPEQLMGLEVTGKADQFSLAVTTYELLSGRKPFTKTDFNESLKEISKEEFLPLETIEPSLPYGISRVLKIALSYDPDNRFPSCSIFCEALKELNQGHQNKGFEFFEAKFDFRGFLEEERLALLNELGLKESSLSRKFSSFWQAHGLKIALIALFLLAIFSGFKIYQLLELSFVEPPPKLSLDLSLHEKATSALVRTIADPKAPVQEVLAAIREVANRGDPQALEAFAVSIQHPSREVRLSTLEALKQFSGRKAVELVAAALADPDEEIKLAALQNLERIRDSRVLGFIKYVEKYDPSERVRTKARHVLQTLKN